MIKLAHLALASAFALAFAVGAGVATSPRSKGLPATCASAAHFSRSVPVVRREPFTGELDTVSEAALTHP